MHTYIVYTIYSNMHARGKAGQLRGISFSSSRKNSFEVLRLQEVGCRGGRRSFRENPKFQEIPENFPDGNGLRVTYRESGFKSDIVVRKH